jgi:hypothetical protein
MTNFILTTPEHLEDIIRKCLIGYSLPPAQVEGKNPEIIQYLHSIRELAEFLQCSVVTAQKLKNSGKIRFKQYGRKVIFNVAEVLQDLGRTGRRVK